MNASKASLFQLSLEECRTRLTQPSPQLEVDRPCTLGDGIEQWSEERIDALLAHWNAVDDMSCGLWVPASGASTRMFGFVHTDAESQSQLWNAVDRLAFGAAWKRAVDRACGSWQKASAAQACDVLWAMMEQGDKPKGLVPFHPSADGEGQTAFEAHVQHWADLFPQGAPVWFTVPPTRQQEIATHLKALCDTHGMALHLPVQNPATDTPVLNDSGEWMKDASGAVLKRPGGHGALLPLLEELSCSIVAIRNIDNAPSQHGAETRSTWSRAMLSAATLWATERTSLQKDLAERGQVTAPIKEWLTSAGCEWPEGRMPTADEAADWLQRPMRIVGMVKNEGQPGGGPFWVRDEELGGMYRPQIVEAVEFDASNQRIQASATHFNPVDMVCILEPGQSLAPFVDEERYLKATKRVAGEMAQVLEHPGLWNGGMSGWLTRFVELPSACFQPVKSALDLIDRH